MKRLLVSTDTVFLEYLRRLLVDRGIGSFVRNPTNTGLAGGELPRIVAPPELWVAPEDYEVAERLLQEVENSFRAPAGPRWHCPKCGEVLEPQYEICWRCGAARPGEAD